MTSLIFKQQLPISLPKAWAFFSDPANLEKITPPSMKFIVTSEMPEHVYEGLMISYKITPLLGIKMNWLTEITHVKEGQYFVDEQRLGPYKIWHHEHHFEEVDGGVMMTDKLVYHVGMGPIGWLAELLVVNKKVLEIFLYRKEVLSRLF